MQAFVLNRGGHCSGRPRPARVQLCLRFRGNEPNSSSTASTRVCASYFAGTELASSGLPTGRELEILQTIRDKVPPEVFTILYKNRSAASPEGGAHNQRDALRLLREAGLRLRDRKLVNCQDPRAGAGRDLIDDPDFGDDGLLQAIAPNGLDRRVDPRRRRRSIPERLRQWDYDSSRICGRRRSRPGNEQREFLGSKGPIRRARAITSASRIPPSMR